MDRAQMMPGAHRGAIVPRIVATARTEEEMMIVEVLPRAAHRHGTPPPVAREHRVVVARLSSPFGLHVLE